MNRPSLVILNTYLEKMEVQVMETRRNVLGEKRPLVAISYKVTDLYVESNRVINFTVAEFRNPI